MLDITNYSVQFSCSVMSNSLRPHEPKHARPPWHHQGGITNSQSSPKPMSTELVMLSNHCILCRPLLLLPSNFPSIRVFSNESALLLESALGRGGKNTQKNCTKKDLHNPDNPDGVMTHLEPDILECEVKRALVKHHYKQS